MKKVLTYFNNSQRQATKDAGTISGWNEWELWINRQLLQLHMDFIENIQNEMYRFLSWWWSFDVSLLTIEYIWSNFWSENNCWWTHLGGEDSDNRLSDHFVQEFKHKFLKNVDFKTNQRALHRLRTVCERVKSTLT